jgi:hypothetical protein
VVVCGVNALVAQWIEHQTSNLGVAGSSPAWGRFPFWTCTQQGGRLAQLVERWSNKPLVVGSSPTVTTSFFVGCFVVRCIRGRVVKALDLSPNGC